MKTIHIRNWSKFQHFKDRRPPWVKLYRELLDDINYFTLSDRAGKYLPLIWLIASESDGALPSTKTLAFRLRMSEAELDDIMSELLNMGFVKEGDSPDDAQEHIVTAKSIAAKNGFGSRHISDATKRIVWERDGGKCKTCEATKDIEYDHIHPVSKGGTSESENIQLLCRPCNRKKRAKTAEQLATHAQTQRSLETETETETETESDTPDGVSAQIWLDFKKLRKTLKAPVTKSAVDGIRREADKAGWSMDDALRECCARGWRGFKAEWVSKSGYQPAATGGLLPGAI